MTDAAFPPGRKSLALYPVFLFYLSLSWIVLIGFQKGVHDHTAVAEGVQTVANGTTPETVVAGSDANGTARIIQSLRASL